jgi:hypothetical protein
MATKKTKAPAGGISKMEAVRQAMGELGNAATRTEIQKFVEDRFGIEMNLDVVSSYKAFVASQAKKTIASTPEPKPVVQQPAAATKKAPKKRKRSKAAPKPVAIVTTAPSVKATGIALNDIQTVKELVKRVGVNTLKGLIDLFSK